MSIFREKIKLGIEYEVVQKTHVENGVFKDIPEMGWSDQPKNYD